MRMPKILLAPIALVLSLGLYGCSDSGNARVGQPPGMMSPPPPPPPPPVNFTTFVKDQFAATADDTDPQSVDDADFAFTDDDNPAAFDDLLTQ